MCIRDSTEAQSAYEQKVLEAAQQDPELMAALEQAAKDAGGGEAAQQAIAQATEMAAKGLVDQNAGNKQAVVQQPEALQAEPATTK